MDTFLKVVIIVLLLSILGFNIFTFTVKTAKKTVEVVEDTAKLAENTVENIVENTIEGAEDVIGMIEPNPDNTDTTNIQKRGKGKYCFIGADRGYRSCIKMQNNDICVSNEIYHNYDKCVNPDLR